jgi:hypothetical protein
MVHGTLYFLKYSCEYKYFKYNLIRLKKFTFPYKLILHKNQSF